MISEMPEWILHLVFTVIGTAAGFAIAHFYFSLHLRIDFKEFTSEFHALNALINEFVPFLKKKMELDSYKPNSPTEESFVHFVDNDYQDRRRKLYKDKAIHIFDFDQGWRLLFTEFFSGPPGTLRDVAFSSHGDTSFQKYDFEAYPRLVGEYIDKYKEKSYEARFMMVCSPNIGDGKNNALAEDFLRFLLKIKYPHCTMTEELFDRWASNDQRENHKVDIMITNEAIVRRAFGRESREGLIAPFNVYGNLAVSRSIVKGEPMDQPLPHLEILLNPEEIRRMTRIFDSIWTDSISFRTTALREMTRDQKLAIGKGNVFHLWSNFTE